ncbi:Putative F-box/FBD/LRR-repeat protein At5g52460 [Linum perenne]
MDRGISPPAVRNSDRLNALPDEILRRILIAADLNLKSAARTSVLSRRWRSIWKSCLTKLDFNIPQSDSDEWNSFVQFVENVISFHNHEYAADLEVLSVSSDVRLLSSMFDLLGRIFAHGLRNRVRTLRLVVSWTYFNYSVPPGLTELCDLVENLELSFRNDEIHMPRTMNLSAVRTLRLYQCSLRSFPGTLNRIVQRYDPFGWIPNLTVLEVIECDFRHVFYPVKISSDKLVHLALVNPKALTMVPGLLEREDSPFKKVHSLEFHNIDDLISSHRVFSALVSYFFDDCIRGTALFERVITRLGTDTEEGRSEPLVVHKCDLSAIIQQLSLQQESSD